MVSVAVSLPRTITSAGGVLAQLEEQDNVLKAEALVQLDSVVDQFWPELADNLEVIELLAEDESFSGKKRACLVLSKVNYHLELYDIALEYALGAEEFFKLTDRTEYVEKMVTKCIDKYIVYKQEMDNGKTDLPALDSRLLDIVERMFARCKKDQEWYHGLGIAIECKRLDKVEDFVTSSPFLFQMIDYCQRNLRNPAIGSREFRMQLVKLLIDIYKKQGLNSNAKSSTSTSSTAGSSNIKLKFITKLLQCYCFANDVTSSKDLLTMLLKREITLGGAATTTASSGDKMDVDSGEKEPQVESEDSTKNLLLVFQLAFDIVENENQQFCRDLVQALKADKDKIVGKKKVVEPVVEAAAAAAALAAEGGEPGNTDSEWQNIAPAGGEVEMQAISDDAGLPDYNEQLDKEFDLLLGILSGLKKLELNLSFLFKNNRTDLLILDKAKKACDQKNAILHTGHMFMHAFMQAGTSSDIYLRQNLDWMSRAVMWAKFSTTASLGVVHRGHIKESKNILAAYLPREDAQGGQQTSGSYAEGGALFAMGLVHGNYYDKEVEEYLLKQLKQGQHSEILRHGACLGLGLSSMGTHNPVLVEEMKQALYTDQAITGEAAAYGMGLVMCGSASEKEIKELLQYAQDTQHEKIIRGCAVSLALIMFQKEESADSLAEQLLLEKDPILRYGGCFVIAMAYCGTASSRSIQKLLHLAVSDVNDDVRRAAVLGLAFVMCNVPTRVPQMVKLLATSYNPHVRYAAALTLGISNAGSANADCEDILRPLLADNTDFVRQGAYVAMSLLYMQSVTDNAEKFRSEVMKCIGEKHEDVATRFGALLAQGIMDAGGRNVCASFFSKSGAVRQGAAVGFLLFTQMWYWYPLIHGLSLSFVPTAVIGLNKDLKMPKHFSFHSDVTGYGSKIKNNLFDYPMPEESKKAEEVTKTKAVLSTAAKKTGGKAGMERTSSKTPTAKDSPESLLPKEGEEKKDGKTPTAAGAAGEKKIPSKGQDEKVAAFAKKFEDADKMEVDEEGGAGSKKAKAGATDGKDTSGKQAKDGESKEKEGEKKKKALPSCMPLHNPSRVIPIQEKYIKFTLTGLIPVEVPAAPAVPATTTVPLGDSESKDKEKEEGAAKVETSTELKDGKEAKPATEMKPVRYVPILQNDRQSGFLLLEDRNPNEAEEFVEPSKKIEDPEPEPPEPFEWVLGIDG
ncbi:unnamed protein product [Amoebophrya sp. A120]|nr:unnamed protein product [Amoebophrya sp. A120]|eukprot:GSA120T00021742001.1